MPVSALLDKYNKPVPRYTSYPTVPNWKDLVSEQDWTSNFIHQFIANNRREGLSLYIHLPFCESLCTYCGCNKKITTNHSVENTYLQTLFKEWKLYLQLLPEKPVIRELHLGGGTPTFFSPDNLKRLLETILKDTVLHPDHQFSFEAHPNNTSQAHLATLYQLGFRRLSLGVQDNDPKVQFVINRIQPFEQVKKVTDLARQTGYSSVNFDLIYGLPKQSAESMERTIGQCISLKPDRVAFYSYAHVPWTSRGQRLFSEADLPDAALKMKLYQLGKSLFSANGYQDIGMDHFALPEDELFLARKENRLHRNFMGYTTQATKLLIGLGVSSISDTGNAYAQNQKALKDYYAAIGEGRLAVTRGYYLNAEDLQFKQYILDISCKGFTRFHAGDLEILKQYSFPELRLLAEDGLIEWDPSGLTVTNLGHHFIRNICSAFDLYLLKQKGNSQQQTFSKAI